MKILRLKEYTLKYLISNSPVREEQRMQDIGTWGRNRRSTWNEHVGRMIQNRIARIACEGFPETRRPMDRPPKSCRDYIRWNERLSWRKIDTNPITRGKRRRSSLSQIDEY